MNSPNRHRCHPESPSGVRDLHLHLPSLSPSPFLRSEVSNLKFEIAVAFVGAPARCALRRPPRKIKSRNNGGLPTPTTSRLFPRPVHEINSKPSIQSKNVQ